MSENNIPYGDHLKNNIKEIFDHDLNEIETFLYEYYENIINKNISEDVVMSYVTPYCKSKDLIDEFRIDSKLTMFDDPKIAEICLPNIYRIISAKYENHITIEVVESFCRYSYQIGIKTLEIPTSHNILKFHKNVWSKVCEELKWKYNKN